MSLSVLAQNSFMVKTDTNRILIGERIQLILEGRFNLEDSTYWPSFQDSLASFEILKTGDLIEEQNGGVKLISQNLWVTSFDTGYSFIPPITVHSGDKEFSSQAIGIAVFLPKIEEEGEYNDIKAPEAPPIEWLLIIGIILVLLLLGFIILRLLRYVKRAKSKVELPPIESLTPYEYAKKQLEQLVVHELWQKGQVKQYYSSLSNIVRLFMERQFGLHALESTADEVSILLEELKLQPELMSQMQQLMGLSVMVIYAKQEPTEADHRSSLNCVERFIENYRPTEINQSEDVELPV